jgi:hypothetical protein
LIGRNERAFRPAREIDVEDVGRVTARQRPNVVLVGFGGLRRFAVPGRLMHELFRSVGLPLTAAGAALDEERELGSALMLGMVTHA